MRSLLRNTGVNAFSFFILSQILEGVRITGGVSTFILGGFVLCLMTKILRPLLELITLPLNIVTFGTFSFLINVIILYLLTILIPQITISPFVFKGVIFLGFVIPQISFNSFFTFVVSAFALSIITGLIQWLIKK